MNACLFCGLETEGDYHPECLNRAKPKAIAKAVVEYLSDTEPVITAYWKPYQSVLKRLKERAKAGDMSGFLRAVVGLSGLLDPHDAHVVSSLASAIAGEEETIEPYQRRREVYGWGQSNRQMIKTLLKAKS